MKRRLVVRFSSGRKRYRPSCAVERSGKAEPAPGFKKGIDETVDVIVGVVEVERRPSGCRNLEVSQQRFGAVMSGSDLDPVLIEDGGDVVGVDVGELEADGTSPPCRVRRTENFEVGHGGQTFERRPSRRR